MLSNSVVLLLKDALPIVWSVTLLLIIVDRWQKWLILGSSAGIALCFIIFVNLSWLSSQFDGQGYELFQGLLLILSYLLAVRIFCTDHRKPKPPHLYAYAALLTSTIIMLKMTNSIVFLSVTWQVTSQHDLLYLSLLLAGGISMSISVLAYLLLKPLKYTNFANYLLIIFAVGNLANTANLLEQTDILSSAQVWNSNHLLSEEHEIGQFFTTILGYESSPTILFVSMYLISLVLAIAFRNRTDSLDKITKDKR